MSPEILISTSSFGRFGREPLDLLERAGMRYRLNPHGRKLTEGEIAELIAGVDGLIAGTEPLTAPVLERALRLRVISRCGTGIDNVDLEAAAARNVAVFNTPDAPVNAVAELTLGGVLNLLRQVGRSDRCVRGGGWDKPMGRLLRGKTVGVVGLGRIGRALVELLAPFGVTVLAADPEPDEGFAAAKRVRYVPLEELLAAADVVTLHLASGSGTRHLFDRSHLETMKPGALLVNCARGGVVDESALCELLAAGRLGGAYLDVFEEEPYKGPLAGLENVLLTPHIGSYAEECRVEMERAAAANLVRFFEREGSR